MSPAEWVARANNILKSGDLSAGERDFVLGLRNRKAWCVANPRKLEYFLSPDQYLKFAEIERRIAKEIVT